MSDAKRLKELEGENAKLKKLLAEAHLDIQGQYSTFPTEIGIFSLSAIGRRGDGWCTILV